MAENNDTTLTLSKKMGITRQALLNRLSNKTEFKTADIKFIKKTYNLSADEIDKIFLINV